MKKLNLLACLVLTIFLVSLPVQTFADAPELKEQFIYRLAIFNGKKYVDSFVPQSEDTIYLLANMNNALSCRISLVHFWPLTGKYLESSKKLNQEVEGKLEILKNGKIIATLEKEKYCLFFPDGLAGDFSEMNVGEEAYAVFKKYKEPLEEYFNKTDEYNMGMVEFQNKFVAYSTELEKKRDAGITLDPDQIRAEMPRMPTPPERPSFDVTGIRRDFIINVPDGTYAVRLRASDGTIAEGSEKKLVAFSRRRVGGVGYEITPEKRWTQQESSNDPSRIIYALGNTTLYFRPFVEDEYKELFYNKLVDPQANGSSRKWVWAHAKPLDDVKLMLKGKKTDARTIEKLPYMVKQLSKTQLGYEVIPYSEARNPDNKKPSLVGYKVSVSAEEGGGEYLYWLEDPQGKEIPGSKRKILHVKRDNGHYLYFISLFPLLVGLIVFIQRKRTTG